MISRTKVAASFVMLALIAGFGPVGATEINGAGSTFAHPLMAKWAEAYKAATGTEVKYQAVGSGAGIKQIQARAVDFGASDMPLKPAELEQSNLIQFPVMIGGVVPVVNIGIPPGAMKLDGPTLAQIYLGAIKRWNDPALAALNPTLKLPDAPINVVFRSDGSGTTFIFAEYLSKVSPEWRDKIGASTSISFPTGVGRAGNDGVATTVVRTAGSIGYVEYAYAKKSTLSYTTVKNSAGRFAIPNGASFQAAASYADWSKAPSYYLLLTDQPGDYTWPIAGSVFIMMAKSQADRERAPATFRFFDWAYKNGGKLADDLDYVTIPREVVRQIEGTWGQVKDTQGQAAWAGPRM
jgi:phosphate transport system substrate-binding protein